MAVEFLNPLLSGLAIREKLDRQDNIKRENELIQQQQIAANQRANQLQDLTGQAVSGGLGSEAFKNLASLDVDSATKLKTLLQTDNQGLENAFQDAAVFKNLLQNDPSGKSALQFGSQRIQGGINSGKNMIHTQRFLEEIQQDPKEAFASISSFLDLSGQQNLTTAQKNTKTATEGFTEEESLAARKIKAGLVSKAPMLFQANAKTFNIGGVPHILDREGKVRKISVDGEEITTEVVANSKAEIKQRVAFESLTGKNRAKRIENSFDKIEKINTAILNTDKAVSALLAGAGTGAIERFLPSFKAASVELDNIQKSMALDVVGAVTFGALSKGELDLSKEVALPIGLDKNQLISYLEKRRDAQLKLKSYFNEQIQFLNNGGNVADFLRSKSREADQGSDAQQAPPAQSFNFDAQGNLIQ